MEVLPRGRGLIAGALGAAAWGVAVEAGFLLASLVDAPITLDRAARARHMLELGLFAAAAGIAVSLALGWLPGVGRRLGRGRLAALGGTLAVAWLALGFCAAPPAPDALVLASDPLVQRLPMIGIATAAVGALALLLAWRPLPLPVGWVGAAAALVLAPAALLLFPPAAPGGARPPDIFLVSVDTLRADHLGCYGYPRPTSPAIDRLCEQAVVFEEAMTSVPETVAAYTTILTGLSPEKHGVYHNLIKAPDSVVTLAERLRDAGYFTAAFLEGPLPGTFGNLDQGFELVVQHGIAAHSPLATPGEALRSLLGGALYVWHERTDADVSPTTRAARRWLRELPREQPLFAHVYWGYPHGPYQPPARHARALGDPPADSAAREVFLYDAEIRFTDAQVEQVLDAVARHRDADAAWIVFTADHGEELGRALPDGEPFFGHSLFLHDSSVRVPLVVRPPRGAGLAPGRRTGVVGTVQIAATLLQGAALPAGDGLAPPLPLADGGGAPSFAVMRRPPHPKTGSPVDRISVREDGWRLIETRTPALELELLRYADGEERPVPLEDGASALAELSARLRQHFPAEPGAVPVGESLSEGERELLRSLGYIQ